MPHSLQELSLMLPLRLRGGGGKDLKFNTFEMLLAPSPAVGGGWGKRRQSEPSTHKVQAIDCCLSLLVPHSES